MHGFDFLVPQFSTRVRGTRIVVIPDIISNVLHVLRVAHLDYPGCDHLRTVSKDELMSAFYECPLIGVIVSSLLVRPLLKVLVFLTWL